MHKEAALAAAEARKQELEATRNKTEKCVLQIKAAGQIITDGNRDLGVTLESKKKTLEKLSKLPKQKIEPSLTKDA